MNDHPAVFLEGKGIWDFMNFNSHNISLDPISPCKKDHMSPGWLCCLLCPSHAQVLVLIVCLMETTSLVLGWGLTWLYVSLQVGRWRRKRSLTSPATVGLKTLDIQPQRNQSNGWEPGHYCPLRYSRPSPRLRGHPGIKDKGKGPTSCPCHIGRDLYMCLSC